MPRAVVEAKIQNRAGRAGLAARSRPYWRGITEGCHVGYYRGARVGKWVARYRKSEINGYVTCTLGEADDVVAANGDTVLDWKQAVEKARRWNELQERGGEETAPDITVRAAVEAYIEKRDARRTARAGRPAHSDAYYTLQRFVLKDPKLPQIALSDVTEGDLRSWQKRVDAGKASSLQRVMNNLKAALNEAWVAHRQALPRDLPSTIKYGLKHQVVSAPVTSLARDNQILSDEQVRKIVSAAAAIDEDGDFARLVLVLAATGARFAQITRMTVQDVQPERSRVMVPQSYKGGRSECALIRVPVGQDTLDALAPVIANRKPSERLLERWRYRQVTPTKWERYGRGPWKAASEMRRRWKQAAEKAGVPEAIPYALRHSSIVRALRFGLPIRLVAALHDTSVAMIERHYSRWITEGLDEMAARAVVPLRPPVAEAA
jgi:integrase